MAGLGMPNSRRHTVGAKKPAPLVRLIHVGQNKRMGLHEIFNGKRGKGVSCCGDCGRGVSEGIPLSEIERKMLYFTESGWTLSDMSEVAAAFDRDYNQSEYEHKIRKLARSARKQLDANKAKVWSSSIKKLDVGDHYLLVMLDLARTDCRLRKSLLALVVI